MLNPQQTPILLWRNQTIKSAFTLSIAGQRLIGFIRKDRKGVTYWKFQEFWSKDKPNLINPEEKLATKQLESN